MKDENEILLSQVLKMREELYLSKLALNKIEKILLPAITTNIKKTQRVSTPKVVKAYRESLLVFRDIEQELKDYHDKTFLHKGK